MPGQLQWGHDKIVMEVLPRIFLAISITLLQWGHDKIVMEVYRERADQIRLVVASMGP